MKKLLFITLLSILSFSCSKDDNATTPNASIDGTWKLTAFTTEEACDLNNDGTLTTNFMNETGCYNNSKIVFATGVNGVSLYLQELDIDLQINSALPNGYLSTIECEANPTVPENLFWTQSGNTVTFGQGTNAIDFNLSGNTLTAIIPEFTDVQTVEGGEIVYTLTSATLVFTKQ